jgi:hypothetical protein
MLSTFRAPGGGRPRGWRPGTDCGVVMTLVCLAGLAFASAALRAAEPAVIDALAQGIDGWTIDGAGQAPTEPGAMPVWTFADGVVRCTGKGFGFLRFDRPLEDFRLELEYRFPKKGNSGIGIRTIPFNGKLETRPSFAAYEVQLLSDAGSPPNKGCCGSLYRYVAPSANPSRPVGEWNSMRIECQGPRIRITHNGTEIIDFDQTTLADTAKKPLRGNVCLQNHGSAVEFRNIRITEILGSR